LKKISYSFEDYKKDIHKIIDIISLSNNPKIFAPYKGGLPLGVKLANSLETQLGILEFQRYDKFGNKNEVSMMKDINISDEDDIWIIDDIYDEGITIQKCKDFLANLYPRNNIFVFTIFRHKKHPLDKLEYFLHEKEDEWITFEPWE